MNLLDALNIPRDALYSLAGREAPLGQDYGIPGHAADMALDPLNLGLIVALLTGKAKSASKRAERAAVEKQLAAMFPGNQRLSERVAKEIHEWAASSTDSWTDNFARAMATRPERLYWHHEPPAFDAPLLDAPLEEIQAAAKRQSLLDFAYGPRKSEDRKSVV